jgi:hypothetical protein
MQLQHGLANNLDLNKVSSIRERSWMVEGKQIETSPVSIMWIGKEDRPLIISGGFSKIQLQGNERALLERGVRAFLRDNERVLKIDESSLTLKEIIEVKNNFSNQRQPEDSSLATIPKFTFNLVFSQKIEDIYVGGSGLRIFVTDSGQILAFVSQVLPELVVKKLLNLKRDRSIISSREIASRLQKRLRKSINVDNKNIFVFNDGRTDPEIAYSIEAMNRQIIVSANPGASDELKILFEQSLTNHLYTGNVLARGDFGNHAIGTMPPMNVPIGDITLFDQGDRNVITTTNNLGAFSFAHPRPTRDIRFSLDSNKTIMTHQLINQQKISIPTGVSSQMADSVPQQFTLNPQNNNAILEQALSLKINDQKVRQWISDHNTTSQADTIFTGVKLNYIISESFLGCNAEATPSPDGSNPVIFSTPKDFICPGGNVLYQCPSTAYGTIAAHELGHYINRFYNSFGETINPTVGGMKEAVSDIIAMLIYGDPHVGTDTPVVGGRIRSGLTTRRKCESYTDPITGITIIEPQDCFLENHDAGEVLMGAVWKMRQRAMNFGQSPTLTNRLIMGWLQNFDDTQILNILRDIFVLVNTMVNGGTGESFIHSGFHAHAFQVPGPPAPTTFINGANTSLLKGFGTDVAVLDDINGDGAEEIVILHTSTNPNGSVVEVRSGANPVGTQGILASFNPQIPQTSQPAIQISTTGDLNGDGKRDLAVTNGNLVTVYDGFTLNQVPIYSRLTFNDPFSPLPFYAANIELLGDLNGDGRSEILIATPTIPNAAGEGTGRIAILSGDPNVPGTILVASAPTNFSNYGKSIVKLGDVDGDGRSDFAVSMSNKSAGQPSRLDIISGISTSVPTILESYEFLQPSTTNFGASLAALGDINGDNHADIAVGNPSFSNPGEVQVYLLGSPLFYNNNPIYKFKSSNLEPSFGTAVHSAGDFNKDGFTDLAVGAPFDDSFGADNGTVKVYSIYEGIILRTFVPMGSNNKVGSALTSGDFNSDGIPDVAIGAPLSNSFPIAGQVMLIYGNGNKTHPFKLSGRNFGWLPDCLLPLPPPLSVEDRPVTYAQSGNQPIKNTAVTTVVMGNPLWANRTGILKWRLTNPSTGTFTEATIDSAANLNGQSQFSKNVSLPGTLQVPVKINIWWESSIGEKGNEVEFEVFN